MACSEARLEANRRNAQKSTGPKTEAGKAVSRGNALKDGFTGAGTVMTPAIKADFDLEYARWCDYYQPTNIEEEGLIKTLALTQTRIIPMHDEMERLEEHNRRYELDCGEGDRKANVQHWYKRLPKEPELAVTEITRTSAGCRWLAARWAALEFGLADGRCKWKDEDLKRLLNLLGIPHEERHINATACDFEDLYKKTRAGDAKAHASLLEQVAGYRQALIDKGDRLESGYETYIREAAESGRRVDLSPAMMRLRRLDAANLRTFTRSLEQFRKLRAAVPKPPAGQPAEPKRPATPPPPAPKPTEYPSWLRECHPELADPNADHTAILENWKKSRFNPANLANPPQRVENGVYLDIVAAAPGSGG